MTRRLIEGAVARVAVTPPVTRRLAAGAVAAVAVALGTGQPTPARAAAPSVRAPAAILVEPATGDVVFARHATARRAIASTTKLMTALLTLERARLGDMVSAAPYRALPVESVMGLRAGERLTVADLLRGLLLASANDAAVTLAGEVAGSRAAFVRLMNRRARALGLTATHFANPIGLDEAGNHSSAEDLVKLALVLRRHRFFREVTDRGRVTTTSGARARTLVNRNRLVRAVPAVNGVKTGHTRSAGYVLVGSATRRGVTVLSAVLGDPSEAARDADTLALLRYGLRRYRRSTAVRAGERIATARLSFREEEVPLVATRTVRRTVRRGERMTTRVIGAPAELAGPLPARARVGTILVRWRGRTIDRVALVTGRAVSEATLPQRADDVLGRTLLAVGLAVVALASLQVVFLRRRARRRRGRPAGETEVA